ncbi:M15 family metallopeptidase [Nocardioides dongxiaopingii]|uniref:M15 family metallopeptidase n=1 Tax=Nocardioides dongxiaopingii TaxID=2576036 RepID=UPI001BAFFFA3|nr:M15 family metallopeptidase [Nocardioides dongxiaopingii]
MTSRTTWDDVVLMCDDAVTTVPVEDAGDALVDVAGALAFTGATAAARHVRRPVLDRLLDAAAALPSDLRLALNEGYRPPALQRHYFERYAARLGTERPTDDAATIHRLASRFISPPAVAPHTAGAAVDVVLTTPGGEVLDVGCPLDASPEESGGRCYTAHPDVTGDALLLRRELVGAMSGAGLVNYPTEWWHWSYGDRYWAQATGAPHALFGATGFDPADGG